MIKNDNNFYYITYYIYRAYDDKYNDSIVNVEDAWKKQLNVVCRCYELLGMASVLHSRIVMLFFVT